MHEIDCENFLQEDNPNALILAILCDFKGIDEKEVIHYIITKLKQYYKENEKGFRESISMLEALSTNRDLKDKIKEEEKMLSARWDELPSYEIGYEKGIEKGIKKGIEKIEKIAFKLQKTHTTKETSELTGLSEEELLKLQSQTQNQN